MFVINWVGSMFSYQLLRGVVVNLFFFPSLLLSIDDDDDDEMSPMCVFGCCCLSIFNLVHSLFFASLQKRESSTRNTLRGTHDLLEGKYTFVCQASGNFYEIIFPKCQSTDLRLLFFKRP